MSGSVHPPLDWMRLPLAAPRHVLIEASAGTGKTHTLTLLYLRLILEAADETGADVRGILVSTFTDAAAAELRLRLRERLLEAERLLARLARGDAIVAPDAAADALARDLEAVLPRHLAAGSALRRVRRARQDLDLAPILTLHGFCARVLAESAFESGADLGAAAVADGNDLLRECLLDFWRRRYQQAAVDPDEAAIVLRRGPEALLRLLHEYFTLHEPRIVRGDAAQASLLVEHLCAPDRLRTLAALTADGSLYAPRKSKLRTLIGRLHERLAVAPAPGLDELAVLLDPLDEVLVAGQQKPGSTLLQDHPLLRDWLRAAELLRGRDGAVRGAVLEAAAAFCREAMAERLQQRGQITFAAMIERVRDRVQGDPVYAAYLAARYPCALLDEFQDTDRHQYAIFEAIYRGRGTLLLVGDPKQAIYGFRGGDPATYREAARQAQERVSLAVNWRSTQRYLDALNALYAHAPPEHLGPGIVYMPVRGGGRAERTPLHLDGVPSPSPLVLRAPLDAPLARLDEGDAAALEACADDLARLLGDGRATLGGRPLQPGDIAVLLPKHEQIADLRECLARRGVPAAGAGRRSVFDTDTALELQRILQALQDGRAGVLRAAWLTDLWGLDAAALRALEADAGAQQALLQQSLALAQAWRAQGPLALCQRLAERAAARLLARQDGERVFTDLRHLGELLQQQATAGLSPHAQLQWLMRQRQTADGGDGDDARQQRIDSDRARVQLRTLASAKGLQWPLVFLPLAWRPPPGGNGLLRFHDAEDRLSIDLGSAERARNELRARAEQRTENARLLYVALTRAQQACWVYWLEAGRGRTAGDTPLGALLAAAGLQAGAEGLHARLAALAGRLPGVRLDTAAAGSSHYRPAPPSARARAALASPPTPPPWQTWSFTALARGSALEPRAAADEPGDEATSGVDAGGGAPPAEPHAELLTLAELRGAPFGDAVHALLEQAGPQTCFAAMQAGALTRALAGHGVALSAAQAPVLAARLDAMRATDLGAGLRLDALPAAQQVAEMEFLLPLADVPQAALRALLARHGAADLLPWIGAARLRGLLGGFIDRVACWQGRYHVIDYKTNALGLTTEDYRGEALEQAMRAHHYPLQALLYVLALHRYLRRRLPGYDYARHMGEALYLFVRAVGLDADAGIWRHRFDAALVLELDRLCEGAGA